MRTCKLVIAKPGVHHPEVYRWEINKPWNEVHIEDCQKKLKQLTHGEYDDFVLKWFDEYDLCVIESEADLQAAFKHHQGKNAPHTCLRIYAAPSCCQSWPTNQRPHELDRTPSSQLLESYADEERKRRTLLVENRCCFVVKKPKPQRHYLWN